jgi:hypothetical protein
MTRSIRIAVPAYSGEVVWATMTSIIRARDEVRALGWACEVEVRPGDGILHRARNVLLTRFLRSDATDLVFWDSDVACAPGDLPRLLAHDEDLVCGPYRFRADPEGWPIRWLDAPRTTPSGLIEVEAAPAGFLRVTRHALERMTAAEPDAWIEDRHDGRVTWLFDYERRAHELHGEDFVFCAKWRAIGGAVWLDRRLRLSHFGQKGFAGDLERHLGRRLAAKTTPAELAEASAALDAAFEATADPPKPRRVALTTPLIPKMELAP